MEHVVDFKSRILFSIFLVSFLPTIQQRIQPLFNASSLLFAFIPPAVTPVTFPSVKLTKSRVGLKCLSCGDQ